MKSVLYENIEFSMGLIFFANRQGVEIKYILSYTPHDKIVCGHNRFWYILLVRNIYIDATITAVTCQFPFPFTLIKSSYKNEIHSVIYSAWQYYLRTQPFLIYSSWPKHLYRCHNNCCDISIPLFVDPIKSTYKNLSVSDKHSWSCTTS